MAESCLISHYLKIVMGESRGAFPLAEGLGDVPQQQEPSWWVGGNKASAFLGQLISPVPWRFPAQQGDSLVHHVYQSHFPGAAGHRCGSNTEATNAVTPLFCVQPCDKRPPDNSTPSPTCPLYESYDREYTISEQKVKETLEGLCEARLKINRGASYGSLHAALPGGEAEPPM